VEDVEYTLLDKVEALTLLLNKALKVSVDVESRIPYYLNAKTYAVKLKRMLENAVKLSSEIFEEFRKASNR